MVTDNALMLVRLGDEKNGLGIWAGTFFDDFPVLCRSDLAQQTEQQVSLLLDLLGMKFARDGKKWMPFSDQMDVLGAVIDFSHFSKGVVYFRHTEARKTELDEVITKHLTEDRMTQKEAETLRGRLIWFEGFMLCFFSPLPHCSRQLRSSTC